MNIKKLINHSILSPIYNIGFIEGVEGKDISIKPLDIHWMKHNLQKVGWYADPFIYDYDENVIKVLAEEYNYSLERGIIVKLIVEKKTYQLLERVPLLKLDTHLSFPAIFRNDGKTYVYPENAQSGSLKYYEYDDKANTMNYAGTIIKLPLKDAIIYKRLGDYYLIAIQNPDSSGKEAVIFKSDNPFEGYKEIKRISSSYNDLRNGGDFIGIGDTVYKISQNCEHAYGEGIIIQKVDEDFNFKKVGSYDLGMKVGLHTYNRCRNLAVVDTWYYSHPILRGMLSGLVSLLLKFRSK